MKAQRSRVSGYLMIECLVYIGMVFVLLGVASVALYQCMDRSVVLRRNADDITSVLHAGERWRADVRAARAGIRLEPTSSGEILHLPSPRGDVTYRFSQNEMFRRFGDGGWTRVLSNLKSSTMQPESRTNISAWCWEIELEPRIKGPVKAGKIRPLFTFIAVPLGQSTL